MVANPHYAPDRYERAAEAVHKLVTERGIGRHGLFHEVGEGTMFPDGTESMSGYALDASGRAYFFWTGWDTERGTVVFTTWDEVTLDARIFSSTEYRQARAEVGLPRMAP